ncbi:MAG: alpha/beta hydrolase [Gammaproteobacteria bacterium]|nr:alpha/beta hydrolase [Gammaproteobacteria bacterium]
MDFVTVENDDINLRVALHGTGSVILCVHGWPELWYSWRHQINHFANQGYAVAAMDVRGYGGSSKPRDIASYTMLELASDVAAVIEAMSDEPVVLFGHDWGAPIVWNTALLYPDLVRGVAGLSVPYVPSSDMRLLEVFDQLYAERFFYQLYFQEEGVAEAELEADLKTALRKIYFALSGDAAENAWLQQKPRSAALLDGLEDPDPFPAWMTNKDMNVYLQAFARGGFRGPLNRYRAQKLDYEQLTELRGKVLDTPAYFVGGERDAVRNFVPGSDLYADPGAGCADFRGSTIIPSAGHWIQQEAPAATNEALDAFLETL